MKTKLIQIFKKSSYWLSVATLGIILGLSIQFAKAWTEPTAIAPNGNVGAPINTGDNSQYKAGALGIGKVLHGYSNAVFDGNVGIGTTAPQRKLDVRGHIRQDTNDSYDIWIQGAGTDGGRNLALMGYKSTDTLYLNYGGEYAGGVIIGGNTRVTGGLRIGDTTTCTNGTIRFNSGAFQGCEDGSWVYLDTCKDTCGKYSTSAWASPYKKGETTICEYGGHYFSCKSSESYTMSRYWNGGNYWDVQCNAGSNCWVRNHPSGSWHNAGIVTHCTRCTGEY